MNQEQRDDWNAFRFIMLGAPLLVSVVALFLGSLSTAIPLGIFSACLSTLLYLRRGSKRDITLHVVMAMLIGYQTVLLATTVDEPNIGFVWYLIIPAVVALLGNKTHVLIWTPFTLLAVSYIWYLYRDLPVFS
ncbi:MAG: hypothetical protein AAAFM81_02570, partial [Pseudomonadota bacterium]